MKQKIRFKTYLKFAGVFLLPICTSAQCELFESEIGGVKKHMMEVSHLTDSLATFAESASYTAYLKNARLDAEKVKKLVGKAYTSSEEAVSMASEAQYYAEVCGVDEIISYAIDAENYATDARDFADEAFNNAKNAVSAKNLGDIHYYVRKAHNAIKEAQKAADDAIFAVSIAFTSSKRYSQIDTERD
ncbi:MAG: hypothetical protein HKN31_05380 [Pricia sp.]|nr:hypothetical protein [Pricia sp.]